jgi:hypothetical protein
MKTTHRASGTPDGPAIAPEHHPLGGFEERLLTELKFVVAEQAAGTAAEGPEARARTRVALPRRRWTIVAVSGAIAAAAAVASVITLAPGRAPGGLVSTEEQPLGSLTSQSARPFLLAMASRASRIQAGRGRFWCAETIDGSLVPIGPDGRELIPPGQGAQPSPVSDYRYSLFSRYRMTDCETPRSREAGSFYQYLGARPATSADVAAWRRAGSPSHWQAWYARQTISSHRGSFGPAGRRGGRPPWGSDQSLPADPAKLKAALLTGLAGPSDLGVKRIERQAGLSYRQFQDENLFWNMVSLLEEPISPAVRATAFRVFAEIPGARTKPGMRDPRGRLGTAVWWGRLDGQQTGFIIIDPATTMLLAEEGFAGKPAWVYKPGTLTQYHLWLGAGWTSHLP